MKRSVALGKVCGWVGAICLATISAALAQPATDPLGVIPPSSLPLTELTEKRAAVEAAQSTREDIRTSALELYDKAIEAQQKAQQTLLALQRERQRVASIPVRLQGLTAQRERLRDTAADATSLPDDTTLEAIERELSTEQAESELVREQYETLTKEFSQQAESLPKLKAQLQQSIANIQELDEKLAIPVDPSEPGVISSARYAAIAAQRALRDAEGQLLRYQLDNHSMLLDLARAERDLAAAKIDARTVRLEVLQQQVQVLRREAATRLREQAEMSRALAQTLPEPVRAIADSTVELTAELQAVTRDTDATGAALALARGRLQEIKSDFEHTQERVRVAGATEAIGRLLRKRLKNLPSLKGYELATDRRSGAISRATDRQIDLEETLRDVGDIPQRANSILAALPWASTVGNVRFIRSETELLLSTQSQRINELAQAYGTYIQQLTALDVAERELLQVAETYANFLREDLLWIRNTTPLGLQDIRRVPQLVQYLIGREDWHALAADIAATIRSYPVPFALSFVVLILLLIGRWRAPRALADIGQRTTKIRTDSYLLTVRATGHTLVLACIWPYLMGVAAVLLIAPPNTTLQANALAQGLIESAKWMLAISLLRHIVRPMGLADRHFKWHSQLRSRLLQTLRWLTPVLVPLIMIIEFTHTYQEAASIGATGRLALIITMLALSVSALHSIAGTVGTKDDSARERIHLFNRGRWIWNAFFVLLPLVIAGLSAAGFHNTAFGITDDLVETYMLVIGLILVRDLSFRWIYVNKRRLRFQDALRRREEARAERESGEATPESEIELLEEPEVDYGTLGDQAQRLLHTALFVGALAGLLAIWADVLPALAFLQEFHLPFNRTVLVDGVEQILPVTLQDALLSVLVVVLTFVAAKDIPGLLGIAVLRHLPLDAGGRYAFQTISQYLIVGLGIVSAFNIIGAQWSSIQWLVAALSLGLGFGLQEIVANFVSGLIMLFERPVRIGDWVTVGNTSGIVSRIKIRATTIVNWDQQELIVPNKEFITGRVLNWSLSSQMNRILINVGIAYGSDVKQALALLAEAAAEHERVVDDPRPVTTFEGFGDNALNLFLRCYLDALDYRLITISELHESINHKFKQAGIVIAFPQRDLHLDTSKPLEIRLHGA